VQFSNRSAGALAYWSTVNTENQSKNMPPRKDARKLVTILFADLSGFTELSQMLDPEDVSDVVNLCFSRLDSIVVAHGGSIDKHEGDLVMALFGVPDSHEDDPERAVKASLEMMDALPGISRSVSKHIGREVELGVHIGINVGEVVFTRVGSEHKKDYTVMGEAVNLAARLYSQAETGDIIVSEPVFKASRYLVDYETLPPVTLKGIDDKVRIFKPVRLKEMPESKRGMGGIYSLLVGRDSESRLLKNLIREKGKVILISGDAGLGKTRLAAEARRHAKGIEWIEGRCLSYGENMTYWPFKEMIKRIFEARQKSYFRRTWRKSLLTLATSSR
jgi:class 3 adenylate cyclase